MNANDTKGQARSEPSPPPSPTRGSQDDSARRPRSAAEGARRGEGQGEESRLVSPAAARCRFYRLLASAFTFPDQEFFEDVRDGRLQAALEDCARNLPFPLELSAVSPPPADQMSASYEEFESEYIRLFEVGLGGGPPCPLYGGEYLGARMKTMEEHLRFYNFFGLKLNEGDGRELPDHITVELEFMHFLSYQEAQAPADLESLQSLRHAQADFLDRHPTRWLPLLSKKLAGQKSPPFYSALVESVGRFVQQDLGYLRAC